MSIGGPVPCKHVCVRLKGPRVTKAPKQTVGPGNLPSMSHRHGAHTERCTGLHLSFGPMAAAAGGGRRQLQTEDTFGEEGHATTAPSLKRSQVKPPSRAQEMSQEGTCLSADMQVGALLPGSTGSAASAGHHQKRHKMHTPQAVMVFSC